MFRPKAASPSVYLRLLAGQVLASKASCSSWFLRVGIILAGSFSATLHPLY